MSEGLSGYPRFDDYVQNRVKITALYITYRLSGENGALDYTLHHEGVGFLEIHECRSVIPGRLKQ